MVDDGQVQRRFDLRPEFTLPRRFLSSTTTNLFQSRVTATVKNATRRMLRSRYLFAGLVM